jgi:glycerol-3-phosphate dehydrogenase (NAD(P)+)
MGLALAKGKTIKEAQQNIQQVVEGLYAAEAVWKLANEIEIEMPICKAVYQILYKNISPREVAQSLMLREIRTE